ncbi:hypothetical protein [Nostoc sp.]|uniref:hypothetical protein n=1 Tax=Nostoc sp. TaxID=1180 RepID=UPI002FFC1534
MQVVKQQQQALNEIKISVLPTRKEQQQFISEIKVGILPAFKEQTNTKLPKEVLVHLSFNFEKAKEDNS